MFEPNIRDLAVAHHELNQSLALMNQGHPAREAGAKALEDLSKAISFHVREGVPEEIFNKVEEKTPPMKDWEQLCEDVSNHCMSEAYMHQDGRACYYHNRLDSWVFEGKRGRITLKCLRGDHV